MRTEWKNDQRNEIGFGIPTVASIRSAASKAVKLAVLLLGDKVAENVIEAQARDFLRLGSKALDSSLLRFAETQNVYAEDEKEEDKKEEDKPKEASKKACACGGTVADDKSDDKKPDFLKEKEKEASAKKADDEVKEDPKEDEKEEPKASEVTPEQKSIPEGIKTEGTNFKPSPGAAAAPTASKKAGELPDALKENQFKKKDDAKKEEPKASTKKADDEMKEDPKKDEEDKKASIKAMDAELKAADEDEMDEDEGDATEASVKVSDEQEVDLNPEGMEASELTAAEASELASIYADDEELENEVKAAEVAKAKKASEKKGIKTLGGGAPKMASTPKGEVDLASIWDSAPDVNDIFK
jgi:hypothetical protein